MKAICPIPWGQGVPEPLKNPSQMTGFGIDQQERNRGRRQEGGHIGSADMATGRPTQWIRQSWESLAPAAVGGQAKDRERILKSGGLLHFVMKEKAEDLFIYEVFGIERMGVDRGQELLHGLMGFASRPTGDQGRMLLRAKTKL